MADVISALRVKKTSEVFTPLQLAAQMLQRLQKDIWVDKKKTFIDNSAGNGNILYVIKHILSAGHGDVVNILENQLFAVEIMPDNVMELQERLGWLVRVNGDLAPNPLLNPDHYSIDPITHALPDGSSAPSSYLHHRNVVCADALEYDYSFGRK